MTACKNVASSHTFTCFITLRSFTSCFIRRAALPRAPAPALLTGLKMKRVFKDAPFSSLRAIHDQHFIQTRHPRGPRLPRFAWQGSPTPPEIAGGPQSAEGGCHVSKAEKRKISGSLKALKAAWRLLSSLPVRGSKSLLPNRPVQQLLQRNREDGFMDG